MVAPPRYCPASPEVCRAVRYPRAPSGVSLYTCPFPFEAPIGTVLASTREPLIAPRHRQSRVIESARIMKYATPCFRTRPVTLVLRTCRAQSSTLRSTKAGRRSSFRRLRPPPPVRQQRRRLGNALPAWQQGYGPMTGLERAEARSRFRGAAVRLADS